VAERRDPRSRLYLGGAVMPTYRANLLSNDHIEKPARILEAADDGDAVEQARRLLDGHDVELWREDKCIVLLKSPKGEAS
jgi:hypothetical protein